VSTHQLDYSVMHTYAIVEILLSPVCGKHKINVLVIPMLNLQYFDFIFLD